MEVVLYFDVYPWTKPGDAITASSQPGGKTASATRYKITTTVPDPERPDAVLTDAMSEEVTEDEQ
jgi:hypothetical protein